MSRLAGFCQGSSHQLQVIARNSFPTSGTAAATRPSDVRLTSPRFERRHVIDDGAGRVRTRIEFCCSCSEEGGASDPTFAKNIDLRLQRLH